MCQHQCQRIHIAFSQCTISIILRLMYVTLTDLIQLEHFDVNTAIVARIPSSFMSEIVRIYIAYYNCFNLLTKSSLQLGSNYIDGKFVAKFGSCNCKCPVADNN